MAQTTILQRVEALEKAANRHASAAEDIEDAQNRLAMRVKDVEAAMQNLRIQYHQDIHGLVREVTRLAAKPAQPASRTGTATTPFMELMKEMMDGLILAAVRFDAFYRQHGWHAANKHANEARQIVEKVKRAYGID